MTSSPASDSLATPVVTPEEGEVPNSIGENTDAVEEDRVAVRKFLTIINGIVHQKLVSPEVYAAKRAAEEEAQREKRQRVLDHMMEIRERLRDHETAAPPA